ncbi:MAG TPA: hypothetical protein VK165_04895 [Azonexus sp.]|nr:hypothetical protein [Azonexus sp.]
MQAFVQPTDASSGLGLSIVRVHGHAGDIALEDNPDGRGLRVVVRLPAA